MSIKDWKIWGLIAGIGLGWSAYTTNPEASLFSNQLLITFNLVALFSFVASLVMTKQVLKGPLGGFIVGALGGANLTYLLLSFTT